MNKWCCEWQYLAQSSRCKGLNSYSHGEHNSQIVNWDCAHGNTFKAKQQIKEAEKEQWMLQELFKLLFLISEIPIQGWPSFLEKSQPSTNQVSEAVFTVVNGTTVFLGTRRLSTLGLRSLHRHGTRSGLFPQSSFCHVPLCLCMLILTGPWHFQHFFLEWSNTLSIWLLFCNFLPWVFSVPSNLTSYCCPLTTVLCTRYNHSPKLWSNHECPADPLPPLSRRDSLNIRHNPRRLQRYACFCVSTSTPTWRAGMVAGLLVSPFLI